MHDIGKLRYAAAGGVLTAVLVHFAVAVDTDSFDLGPADVNFPRL